MYKYLLKESIYGASNYSPLNVIIKQGKGVYLKDINNKKYLDFLSGYSAVNQGHCHPRLIKAINKQSKLLTLTSRAFYNTNLGELCDFMCNTFKYEKYLPMNTGVEGGETAIKLSRKWGYEKKNIQKNDAINLFCSNNFWGRTLSALSSSNDYKCYNNFGPYTKGFELIEYNNLNALEEKLKKNPNIVSFMAEPIQGEAGVIIPHNNYLKEAYKLCKKYNVLMILDEVQSGLGRSGKLLACDYSNIKPDILILGKSLSGGFYPVSGVLTNSEIMNVLTPGTHGSTYGGNPLANAISIEAINILFEEKLIENSYNMGKYFRHELSNLDLNVLKEIRGKGLFNAIEFHHIKHAEHSLQKLMENGLLTQLTKKNTLRLTPPLIINKSQIDKSLEIIKKSLTI
jgi:ornithine--oxo-acid transaminase